MRRRAVKQGHWGLVLLCLGVAFLPLDLRAKIRTVLLSMHAKTHRFFTNALPAGTSDRPDSDQVALLTAEVQSLRRALRESGVAREAIQLDPKVKLIPAEVLPLAGGADLVRRVALARGSLDGVRRGQPVLADGVLVGRVAKVTPSTCEVRLVTDPAFSIRATIQRDRRPVEGLLRGRGDGLLAFVPAHLDESLAAPTPKPGETVLCSRASVLCGVPALIGQVVKVVEVPGSPLPEARIKPARDATTLDRVVVVAGPESSAP